MNPLDKITGTIVAGLAIAIVIAVVNSMAAQPFAMGTGLKGNSNLVACGCRCRMDRASLLL